MLKFDSLSTLNGHPYSIIGNLLSACLNWSFSDPSAGIRIMF